MRIPSFFKAHRIIESAVKERFAPSEHNVFDAEPLNRRMLALKPFQIDLSAPFPLPNIAHYASAVAILMHVK